MLLSPSDTSVLFEPGWVMPSHMKEIALIVVAGPVLSIPAASGSAALTTGFDMLRTNGWVSKGLPCPTRALTRRRAQQAAPLQWRGCGQGETFGAMTTGDFRTNDALAIHWCQWPATVIRRILRVGATTLLRKVRSLPTISIPSNISLRFPATVISSTG